MRTARDPARTRDALLQAAFGEMHRTGFRGADLESMLGRAGVTKGAMYHHFENKEALGYAVVDEVIAAITREKWVRPLAEADDPVEALVRIVRSTSLDPEHVACGCPLNNLSQEMAPLDEGFRARTRNVFDLWHGAIAGALRRGRARGQVRKDVDPDDAAAFVIAAYEGHMSLGKCYQDAKGLKAGLKMLVQYLQSLRPAAADAPT